MAQGMGSVGFYGSEESIKTYTARGMVINLANRMNGKAPINSIVVTGEMKCEIARMSPEFASRVEWKLLPPQTLKGFEAVRIDIWNVELT